MPRLSFKRVKTDLSKPVLVSARDGFARHVGHTNGECPTSDHSKKRHKAQAVTRQTETATYADGRTSKSYIDHCVCQFCGHVWDQEWMPGLI